MKVKLIPDIDIGIQIVLADIVRARQEMASDCLRLWDSMEGKLPSFAVFCKIYMEERWKVWIEKAGWN